MLIAHLVPGYLAAATAQSTWSPEWTRGQRLLLWTTALGSTVLPDVDVVYNVLWRGFFHHSTLWTHSLLVYLGVGLVWLALLVLNRGRYLRTLIWLVTLGGLAHLALDVIAHGTPLFYPLSMAVIGAAPARVVQGGHWAYLTDPIFMLEPLLIGGAMIRRLFCNRFATNARQVCNGHLVS